MILQKMQLAERDDDMMLQECASGRQEQDQEAACQLKRTLFSLMIGLDKRTYED